MAENLNFWPISSGSKLAEMKILCKWHMAIKTYFFIYYRKMVFLVRMPPEKEVLWIYSFGYEWNIFILPLLDTLGYPFQKIWCRAIFFRIWAVSRNRGQFSIPLKALKVFAFKNSFGLLHKLWAFALKTSFAINSHLIQSSWKLHYAQNLSKSIKQIAFVDPFDRENMH